MDATPVTRDVFFSSDNDWHTILAGGVGLGGRGVYALDITGPSGAAAATPTTAPTKVLWELDSDMTIANTCKSIVGTSQSGTCQASDLGYTVSQPNIGRLHTGQWAVLVPNGYFPDCSKPDYPTADFASCSAIAAQAPGNSAAKPTPYSALFVMDAETGTVLAELKTPTGLTVNGVTITSFGLATPVMGDYDNDQVDDVAFAGDLQGNLWRFDLKAASPTGWSVTLVYAGLADASGNQGLQPITTMPRLFPDPATNRFMVVFGTGKYLGAGDNSSNAVQSMMGVRDVSDTASPYSQMDLTPQYLHETTAPATLPDGSPNPNADATLRCVTGGASDTCALGSATSTTPIPAVGQPKGGGWFINLYTTTSSGVQNNSGERVVVSPGAIFASNTVVFETLLAGAQGSDPCNPATLGAVMALNAVTGAPAGVSSLGGWPIIGGRISNARTSGSLPLVSALGGGQAYLPGTTLAPSGTKPLSIDAPIWRRRSWQGIQQN
jgi:type IV pilus assembly protein PilY1